MFTRKEKQLLHNPYFRVIREEDFFIEVMSVNTKHCWNIFKHISGRGVMLVLYHKHNENDRYYHQHRICRSVEQAVNEIMSHDDYVIEQAAVKDKKAVTKERQLKVYESSGRNYKSVPQIRLQGDWLRECGFESGASLRVLYEDGRIVITKY